MTSTISALLLLLFNVIVPAKQWFGPAEPLLVRNHSESAIELRLTDFGGSEIGTDVPRRIEPNATADLRVVFPSMQVGTYVAYAVPVGKPVAEFVGTPIVLTIRADERPGLTNTAAGVRVAPLSVAKFDTTAGPMTAAFYYDFAPNTVTNFLALARGGFYDGLTFHRLVPGFLAQTGDPTADGSGGPGYHIEAEFNGRPHLKGVLSMARETDPMESQGAAPRPEFANTAGSQFFLALDYNTGARLDGKYTAFGKLVGDASYATLDKIAKGKLADAATGKPAEPVTINRCEIVPVTAADNPYFNLVNQAQIVERVEQ